MSNSKQRVRQLLLSMAAGSGILACSGGESDYKSIANDVIPSLEKSVGLPFKTPPVIEARTKEQVREFILEQLNDSSNIAKFKGVESAYKAFGLIPDSLDVKKLMVDLLEEQVVGYYDPKDKILYVVEGADKNAVKVTVAHELVHALQDQYISLDSLQYMTDNNDRLAAVHAVFEGQAVFEQMRFSLGGFGAAGAPGGWDKVRDIIRNSQEAMPVFSAAPRIIQETLLFPYLSGAEFVRAYRERNSAPYDYQNLPMGTRHVIRPSTFFDNRVNPMTVSFVEGATAGAIYQNTLGEFDTRILLFEFLREPSIAVSGSGHWAGDRYVVFKAGDGVEQGVAWAVALSSREGATDFFSLMQQVANARQDRNPSRSVKVSTEEIDGVPVVLYVDVPKSSNVRALDLSAVRVVTN